MSLDKIIVIVFVLLALGGILCIRLLPGRSSQQKEADAPSDSKK